MKGVLVFLRGFSLSLSLVGDPEPDSLDDPKSLECGLAPRFLGHSLPL